MKILQVGSYLNPDLKGGAEISALNVEQGLARKGHQVARLRWSNSGSPFFTRVKQMAVGEWEASNWRPYQPIESGKSYQKPIFYGLDLAARLSGADFQRMLEFEGIDAIFVHSFRGIGHGLLSVIADAQLPTVFFLHDYATICLNKGQMRKGVNCETRCMQCGAVAKLTAASLRRIPRLGIVGPSNQIVQTVRAALGVENAQYHHIPNPNRYEITPRVRAWGGRLSLGYFGRLEQDKGVLQALSAVDELAGQYAITCKIAGDGSLAPEVKEFARTRPWVEYLGFVNPADMHGHYASIDCLLLPSLWAENFPGVAVQAIMSGAPVIGFDIGGISEIALKDTVGLLADPGDFGGLQDAVRSFFYDPGQLERMSKSAIASSVRYDSAQLLDRLERLLVDLTN